MAAAMFVIPLVNAVVEIARMSLGENEVNLVLVVEAYLT